MEEIFRLQISGKFNGRDAKITVGLDAESAFEIDEMETSAPEEASEEVSEEEEEETEAEAQQPPQTEPASTESPEGAGLDQLFPEEEEEGEARDLPPLSVDTLQFKPAKVIYDHEDERLTSREVLELTEEEYPDEDWNESKVTSHLYSLHDKGIVDREKDEASGKNEYYITDLGKTTVKMAMAEAEEEA